MKLVEILVIVIVAGTILACQSAQDKAAKSQDAVNKERVELVDKYKKCMEKAEKDKQKEAECEPYLKAAEALK